MTRAQVLANSRRWFDDGHYQALLKRRVAQPTASDQPGNNEVLKAYLVQEIAPELTASGFDCQVFDNPVAKVQQFLDVMEECGTHPEFECFDVGIVRSVTMYIRNGMLKPAMGRPEYNLVMGVASGMPCDAQLLELLPQWMAPGAVWQATLIGRQEIWPVHQKTADLGGMLRTGLEDTFYLPDGSRASGNGPLIEALAQCARNAGRAIASPAEARQMLGLA